MKYESCFDLNLDHLCQHENATALFDFLVQSIEQLFREGYYSNLLPVVEATIKRFEQSVELSVSSKKKFSEIAQEEIDEMSVLVDKIKRDAEGSPVLMEEREILARDTHAGNERTFSRLVRKNNENIDSQIANVNALIAKLRRVRESLV